MKRYGFGLIALLLITLTLALAAANFTPPVNQSHQAQTFALMQQPTFTSQSDSEIGSTDGILIMGIVIVMIVTLPLLFRKK